MSSPPPPSLSFKRAKITAMQGSYYLLFLSSKRLLLAFLVMHSALFFLVWRSLRVANFKIYSPGDKSILLLAFNKKQMITINQYVIAARNLGWIYSPIGMVALSSYFHKFYVTATFFVILMYLHEKQKLFAPKIKMVYIWHWILCGQANLIKCMLTGFVQREMGTLCLYVSSSKLHHPAVWVRLIISHEMVKEVTLYWVVLKWAPFIKHG